MEIDLVAHCGKQMEGRFLWSLVATYFSSGWSECLPLLNRNGALVMAALRMMEELLPFTLRGIDEDNDRAFLNALMESIYMVALGDESYADQKPEKPEYINNKENIGIYAKNRKTVKTTAKEAYSRVKSHLEELLKLAPSELEKKIPWTDQGSFDDMNREANAKYRQYFLLQSKDKTLPQRVKVLPAAYFKFLAFHFDRPSIDKYFAKSPITDKVPPLTKKDVQAFVITGTVAPAVKKDKSK